MKSIDKLRESLKDCTKEAGIEPNKFDTYWITAKACDMLIDEIEAEIERDYMRLPVDADGVPIRHGDTIADETGLSIGPIDVISIGAEGDWLVEHDGNTWELTGDEVHVNPRTLEDVLVDMLEVAVGYSDAHTDVALGSVERYADEIRELLGSDGEC